MNKQRSVSLLGLALAASLAVAACGSDSDDSSTTDAPADTTAGTTADTTAGTTADTTADTTAGTTGDTTAGSAATGEGVSLAGDCPDTVVIQTDWMPEAEHGFLYQMVGEGYEIDAGKAYVTGPLIDAAGNDTGVKIQIRSGGAAQNFSARHADHVRRRLRSPSATSTPTRRSSSPATSRPWPSSPASRRTRR